MPVVQRRKRAMVQERRKAHEEHTDAGSVERCTALRDASHRGPFRSSCAMAVAEPSRGAASFLELGSRGNSSSARPGRGQANDHVEALEPERLPGHLIVLGRGYAGLELSQGCAPSQVSNACIPPSPAANASTSAAREKLNYPAVRT
jgi:pyruvate/2-oxoglutarate dehydrogenase complex dihydrolipoamide dehydrogenase (E3) component